VAGGREGRLAPFRRGFLAAGAPVAAIGAGDIGGKAAGLVRALEVAAGADVPPGIRVFVPAFVVVAAGVFRAFLERNHLRGRLPADDDRAVAGAFLQAELPAEVTGDLWDLAREAHAPLAVRSSGILEDARERPFAGVYLTKMIPNASLEPARRFLRLVEAIKLVWASTFFSAARAHRAAAGKADDDDAMAVVIQEVVGRRYGDRFYPQVSGVARTVNFYPMGAGRPEDGVVDMALGLGKTVVDGGRAWTYCPRFPAAPSPYSTVGELLDRSQRDFWAVNMGTPPYDPAAETEYLVREPLSAAEAEGALPLLASTYDPASDRIVHGLALTGPRLLDFATLLGGHEVAFNDALRAVMDRATRSLGEGAEIEFAATLPTPRDPEARLGLVQLRPLAALAGEVVVTEGDLRREDTLVSSRRVAGQVDRDDLRDVVFVDPSAFDPARTREAAQAVAARDAALRAEGRPYVLLGFGRWGSSDPWLGIPLAWSGLSGAAVLVEATLPGFVVEASQGAHFFHNLVAARAAYLCVPHAGPGHVDWPWLDAHGGPPGLVRHVRLDRPLRARVDVRRGRGVILRP
jgi:hypothetical protein